LAYVIRWAQWRRRPLLRTPLDQAGSSNRLACSQPLASQTGRSKHLWTEQVHHADWPACGHWRIDEDVCTQIGWHRFRPSGAHGKRLVSPAPSVRYTFVQCTTRGQDLGPAPPQAWHAGNLAHVESSSSSRGRTVRHLCGPSRSAPGGSSPKILPIWVLSAWAKRSCSTDDLTCVDGETSDKWQVRVSLQRPDAWALSWKLRQFGSVRLRRNRATNCTPRTDAGTKTWRERAIWAAHLRCCATPSHT
jgi:hypothetical protein